MSTHVQVKPSCRLQKEEMGSQDPLTPQKDHFSGYFEAASYLASKSHGARESHSSHRREIKMTQSTSENPETDDVPCWPTIFLNTETDTNK